MGITGEEIDDLVHRHVTPLLEWATAGGTNNETHPHYVAVTEGRDVGKFQRSYSSCGDLAHWLLFRLGCRQEWINRKEHRGWASGMNVSRLAFTAPLLVRRSPIPGIVASKGDIFICWNHPNGDDAHVFLCGKEQRLPGQMTVAEFGQPGGHIRDRVITGRDGYIFNGQRRIQRWLPLHLCITDAAERGELEAVSYPDGLAPDTIPSPPPEDDNVT